MTIAPTYPTDRYGLIHREAALSLGFTDNFLAAEVKAGRLVRLIRGVFTLPRPAGEKAWLSEETLFRLRSTAAVVGSRHSGATILSHESAASVHRLGLLKPRHDHVHLTGTAGAGGQIRGPRHVYPGPVAEADIAVVDGLRITGLAKTAADIARASTFAQALTVFDSALRRGAAKKEIAEHLKGRRPGGPAARAALRFADKDSESVGESWSRAQMIAALLPGARLQREYRVSGKTYRVDFDWAGRLIGECDGMVKYDELLRPGESAETTMAAEKRRELALRRLGLAVVRWNWGMLERGEVVPLLIGWLDALGLRGASPLPVAAG
ncbi:hypothetical protein [Gordonia sp. FQ]|uniref:hypothetical protein n=1 Tax=Gordonia sp. FQ TaxID=3446634 RepID=UPI003F834342